MDSPNNLILVLIPLFYNEIYLFLKFRIVSKLNVFLIVTCLILTMSSTGLIALFLPLSLYFIFTRVRVFIYGAILSFVIFFVFYYLFISYSEFSELLNSRFNRLATGSGRFDLFHFIFVKILDSPYIGFGISQARVLLEGFQGRDLQSTHNSFLEVAIEGGLFSLLLFIICWISLFIEVCLSVIKKFKACILCFIFSLLLVSSANMMVYVEMMMFCLFIVLVMIKDSKSGQDSERIMSR
ncbi:O-antigen ligase family protein [Shewanella japonica]|uniref:O-antigen ligase family protein n=1 Tax=Shewanella japonica TaxID=93973 RepID=UPI0013C3F548|nr:O-antigen ligase family protein [Shewanella japonica]